MYQFFRNPVFNSVALSQVDDHSFVPLERYQLPGKESSFEGAGRIIRRSRKNQSPSPAWQAGLLPSEASDPVCSENPDRAVRQGSQSARHMLCVFVAVGSDLLFDFVTACLLATFVAQDNNRRNSVNAKASESTFCKDDIIVQAHFELFKLSVSR
ncbi:hypothetical protein L596_027022 [Steinernema carpocapsae]|uniref:Uncharacterized protein n=1 Tax=Steinernema carpocapsae TaxID=34508 RepID=A0A4U5M332_STECR|nr:hypothetical protein L596_027022 [Steinernema carpocapsae]